MQNDSNEVTTKQRILDCAAVLFAEKGFTETSIRELAMAVGVNGSSIYSHFPSKGTILEQMLEDYYSFNTNSIKNEDVYNILRENPTTDGILKCLQISFPAGRLKYYQTILCVLLQEQFRNPIVRDYMTEHLIWQAEKKISRIVEVLKELGIFRKDSDCDYWMKINSSLLYTFASRMLLGIGDRSPDFAGMDMAGMLKFTLDLMFEKCCANGEPAKDCTWAE